MHLWGRSEVGSKVKVHQPFCQKQCFSMLATLVLDEGIIAADLVEGSFTQDLFIKFLWDNVVCIHSLQLCVLFFFVHVCGAFS